MSLDKYKQYQQLILRISAFCIIVSCVLDFFQSFYTKFCIFKAQQYVKVQKYEQAIFYYKKILFVKRISGRKPDPYFYPFLHFKIGLNYAFLKKYDEAKIHLHKAIRLYRENKTNKFLLQATKKILEEIKNLQEPLRL